MTTNVALVTCADMPKPDLDEPTLLDAFDEHGLDHELVVWDDGSVDWEEFDVVVLRTPWDYVHRLEEFLAWTRSLDGVVPLVNPARLIEWNHHKRYLFDLEMRGVPIVPTRMVARHAPFPFQRAVLRQFEGEVVIKPAIGIGAFGAARLEAGTEEAFAHLEALCLLGDVLVQPFVPSVPERGEVSIVRIGGETHAVRKVPTSGDYRVQDHHGGSVVDHDPTPAELAVADAAIREAINESGGPFVVYSRVDLVDFAGPTVMEVELIEPELFLRRAPDAADRFALAIDLAADIWG